MQQSAAAAPATFIEAYQLKLDDGWQEDGAQETAVEQLSALLTALKAQTPRPPKGVYLYGPVGRGKSQLLSLFLAYLGQLKYRRVHMHAFLPELHQRINDIKHGDPVIQIAQELAADFKVLGFDEFYVTNLGDGILLGRLFELLFKRGVVVVATSNWPIDELFQGGRNRQRMLPYLRLLRENLRAVDLGSGQDYRQQDDPHWPLYVLSSLEAPAAERLQALFDGYSDDARAQPSPYPLPGGEGKQMGSSLPHLEIEGKQMGSSLPLAGIEGKQNAIKATALRGGAGWYKFADICREAHGRLEYLELVKHFDTLVIEDVPVLGANDTDAALRLVTLIDICYEHHRRVIISAAVYPAGLYPAGPVIEAFHRVASRLAEMQTWV